MNGQMVRFPNPEVCSFLTPLTLAEFNEAPMIHDEYNPYGRLKNHVAVLVEGTNQCNYVYVPRKDLPGPLMCPVCKRNKSIPKYLRPQLALQQVRQSGVFMAGTALYICNHLVKQGDGKMQKCGGNIYPMYPIEDLIRDLQKPAAQHPMIVAYLFDIE